MTPQSAFRNVHRRRHGTVLIVAILIVFALAGMVLALTRAVRVEAMASSNDLAIIQAAAIERGAEQYVLAILTQYKDSLADITEDNYAAIQVGEGYFWILRPDYEDPEMEVFGLMDESGKLNINSASYDALMMLPNMTDEAANSVIDWRDADENISSNGAESQYYSSVKPVGYNCKNGPFETVEELLMVRGWNRMLLYGTGQAPPLGEQTQVRQNAGFMTDSATARGLYDLLTIHSNENAAAGAATGPTQVININERGQRTQLREMLRQQLGDARGDAIANNIGTRETYRDIFDFYFVESLKLDEFEKIADRITTRTAQQTSGRININTAPLEVLMCLGIDSGDAEKIISMRKDKVGSTSVAWLVEALDKKAIGLETRVTGKSANRWSADILAVSGNGKAFKRVRVVVNASGTTPQIVYRRDITDRGWPMDMSILDNLRTGQGPGAFPGGHGAGLGGMR